MSRRANTDLRCPRCRMLGGLCVCALVPSPPLPTRTRLVLILHKDEARKPTNTGRLAALCLADSATLVRGDGPVDVDVRPLLGPRPLLLFPDVDARPLADVVADGDREAPVTLIVPDGTWRQAQRVRTRVPGLAAVPCATLPEGPPTRYRLRHEPRPGGLATAEAIARAYAVLEGDAVAAAILRPFRAMVERTLWARGALAAAAVTDGLPPGVTRASRHGLMTPAMPDRAILEPHIVRAIRDLLDRAPAYRRLPDAARQQLVHGMVDLAGTLALEDVGGATDLPTFVAELIEGTFDAVVGASLEQLHAYADLVHGISVDEEDPPRIRARLAAAGRPARPGVMGSRLQWPP